MRTIYIRNLIRGYLKKKWLIIVGLIFFVLVFGFIGLRRAYPERMYSSLSDEVKEFNEAVATYDETIAGIEDNIEVAQEQLAEQQEYCDNSILMQINPEETNFSTIQYIVTVADAANNVANDVTDDEENNVADNSAGNTQISNIISTMKAYFDNGSMKTDLAEKLGYDTSSYLVEIISCNISGTTLTLGAKHYDMDEATRIVEAMAELMEEYQPKVEEQLGAFSMTSMGVDERTYANTEILSTQTTNLNNLRNYRTNLTDLQTKLVSQQTDRKNYIEQYQPAGTSSSPRRTLIEYGGVGVIAGIIIPLMLFAIYYTLSNRIKGKEEILAADLNVLATYRSKKGYVPTLEKAAVGLELLAQRNHAEEVSLCVLGESSNLEQVEKDVTEALTEHDLQVYAAQQGDEDAEHLQKQAEIGNHLLVVEAGRTTYTQLEEQIQFCQGLDITIWGCVVIE